MAPVPNLSMAIYAFSNGVKLGLYKEPEPYAAAARKAWQAIVTSSVDRNGNVAAICKGSGYSYTKEYYKNDLFWVTNDNHGVGIVLLAGGALAGLKSQ